MLRSVLLLVGFIAAARVGDAAVKLEPQAIAKITDVTAIDLEENSDETYPKLNGIRQPGGPDGSGDGTYWRFGGSHPMTRRFDMSCFEGNTGSASIELIEQDGFADPDEHLGTVRLNFDKGKLDTITSVSGITVVSNNSVVDPMVGTLRTLVLQFSTTPGCVYHVQVEIVEDKLGANVCIDLEWADQASRITGDENVPPPGNNTDEAWLVRNRQLIEKTVLSPVKTLAPLPHGDDYYEVKSGTNSWKGVDSGLPLPRPSCGGGVLFPKERDIILYVMIREKDSISYFVEEQVIDPATGKPVLDKDGKPVVRLVAKYNDDDTVGVFSVALTLVDDGKGGWEVQHTWTPQDYVEIGKTFASLGSTDMILKDPGPKVCLQATGEGAKYKLMGSLRVAMGAETCEQWQ